MKKTLLKSLVFVIVFVTSIMVIGKIMNKDHDNLTMEMAQATLPVVTMECDGIAYNQLHGYVQPMEIAFQRDSVTMLGQNRNSGIMIDLYGRELVKLSMQVRNVDGSRLIEDTVISDYVKDKERITAQIALKDLIEKDTEYSLTLILELENEQKVYYYSRIIWSEQMYAAEKLTFVKDFHEKLYNREAAKELTRYLETNSRLEDNKSFHKVNIHSSFKQITWGDLAVREVGDPVITLTAMAKETASLLVDYMVATGDGNEQTYYRVQEYFRVRYTTDRMYLLDYERTMTQIPDVEEMYANDKILLGITDVNVPMMESEDGNIVVFEVAGMLCSYNVTTNKLAVIFSFYDTDNLDARTLYRQHAMKILDVDEGGNVCFGVYGYMNRGRHEGEVGIQIYSYDSALNTIEELLYIPYGKPFSVLQAQIEELFYLNREQILYLSLENTIYGIDYGEKTYHELVTITQDDSLQISDNHRIIVWQDGDNSYHSSRLMVRNLNNEVQKVITVEADEAILPLGFMGEDIIYGIAREEDIVEESSGRIFFPMYKIGICNSEGELLKEYQQPDIFTTGCTITDNQITLERLARDENGSYKEITADHIMNNVEEETGKNTIVAADIDVYERYVQIKTKKAIDSKNIQILTPKEVVFEGGRELALEAAAETARYYVYGPYGVEAVYNSPGKAVNLAYDIAGVVVNDAGSCVWLRGNRSVRNQIMAIKAESVTEEKNSLVVCLDTMLKGEGIIRNCEYLLAKGETVLEILQENLPDAQVLDLSGCELDAVLYYVNQDIPVLALLENDEAVLITGFNQYNVVIMDPVRNFLGKMGMNDAAEWLAENGNHFVTYMRLEE